MNCLKAAPILLLGLLSPLLMTPASAHSLSGHDRAEQTQGVGSDTAPTYIVISRTSHFGVRDKAAIVGAKRDGVGSDLVIARVNTNELDEVTTFIHEEEQRCGGYFAFATQKEAEDFIANDRSADAINGIFGGGYTIDNQATVEAWIPEVSEPNILATISHLSSYQNRYYTSSYGKASAEWIRDTWQELTTGRPDASAALFTGCTNCSTQPSVILTIEGQELPDEIVILGAHLDSISNATGGNERRAPGADDDASGIAAITEIIRIAMESGWKPKRTVKFMGYAAEEVGLLGSKAIAQRFRADNLNVVGVLQLDMTNYKSGNVADIRIINDNSNTTLVAFLAELFDAYLAPLGYTRAYLACGYGCSDHASWTNSGYPAAMLFEAGNGGSGLGLYPGYHTINDTLAGMDNSAVNTAKFTKLGLAFLGEVAKTHDDSAPGNFAPTADFSFLANGMSVSFTDTSSDTDGIVVSRAWDFGDGATSNLPNPTHVFTQIGTHTVLLIVTDDGGLTANKARDVSVSNEVIVLSRSVPVAGASALAGSQQFFTLDVPQGAFDLRFDITGAAGEDADLRIEFGGQLVCSANGQTANERCSISHPSTGTYTAIVEARTNLSSFSITGSYREHTSDTIFWDGFDP